MSALPPELQERLRRLRLAVRRTFPGGAGGERRAKAAGVSTEFRDHRPYVPGDDLRHLDWNVYARLERLHVKRFHDLRDVTAHLVVDATASMGQGTPPKLALAGRLAAALGWVAIAAQDRARLHVVGGPDAGSSGDFVGRAMLPRFVQQAEGLRAGGAAALDEAFGAVARRVRRPGLVIVLSDLLSPGVSRGLERLAGGRHQLHVIWLLSPEDAEPDRDARLRGELLLSDCETGEELPVTLSPRVRQAYRDALAAHGEEIAATLRRLRAGLTRLASDATLEDALLRRLVADGVVV